MTHTLRNLIDILAVLSAVSIAAWAFTGYGAWVALDLNHPGDALLRVPVLIAMHVAPIWSAIYRRIP